MTIRRMTLDDAEAVADLCSQLGYPATGPQIAARLRRIEAAPDHALFVADDDGRVVGWVHVHVPRLLEEDPVAEVWGLVVDENERGRGIGRRLMAAVEQWATGGGYQAVRLRSNMLRHEAHHFYQRLGYRVTKRSYTFRKELKGAPGADPAKLL